MQWHRRRRLMRMRSRRSLLAGFVLHPKCIRCYVEPHLLLLVVRVFERKGPLIHELLHLARLGLGHRSDPCGAFELL